MQTPRVLVSVVLLLACAPKSADTIGETGSSTDQTGGAEVTSATQTTPTTSAGPTTTSSSAEGSATAHSTSTSTSTDTGDDTGGGGLPGACALVCMRWDMCSPGSFGTVEECTTNCIAGTQVPSECAMALAAQWNCVAALSCEEAVKFLDGSSSSCLAERGAADMACADDPSCGGEVSGGDGFCELEQDCDRGVQNIHCDTVTNTCTCTENDVPGAQCPENGFCAQSPAEQRAAVAACCGWMWK